MSFAETSILGSGYMYSSGYRWCRQSENSSVIAVLARSNDVTIRRMRPN